MVKYDMERIMQPGATELSERAEDVFNDLGYTVERDGEVLYAQRGWKRIAVTPTEADDEVPETGSLRCFVTSEAQAPELRRRIKRADPEYEWAIITVDDEEYEVTRAPPAPTPTRLT